VLTKITLH